MNAHDSQIAAGILKGMGCIPAETMQDADLILFNTCCIRELAEKKAYASIGAAQALKRNDRSKIIGVFGCMTQQEKALDTIKKRFPLVDFAFGTNNLYNLQRYIENAGTGSKQYSASEGDASADFLLPPRYGKKPLAFTNIMQGCNNFCTYCIVPYVRGREISRAASLIVNEATELAENGYKEVTLLGQNVNSYNDNGITFPDLLHKVNDTGIERIRFMTSHPKDLSNALIKAMAKLSHVCKQIHLPVQSGSNAILRAMNRRYTREHYLNLIKKLREAMPEIGVTTDIIVGFPGETKKDYNDTLELVSQVRFDAAYTFAFSPREGTPAAKLHDRVHPEVKSERLRKLIDIQKKITIEIHSAMVGKVQKVLVEGISKRSEQHVTGRTDRGRTVNFSGTKNDIGKILDIKITRANINTLFGEKTGGNV